MSGAMSAFGTSRHPPVHRTCPFLGVKRTSGFTLHMYAIDPKRVRSAPEHRSGPIGPEYKIYRPNCFAERGFAGGRLTAG